MGTKVVFKKLATPTARSVDRKVVVMEKETVQGPDGPREIVVVKTDKDSFARDLTYVFGRNVARARREDKRITGVADRAPAKA